MANPLTFTPEHVVLCGQTTSGDIIPIRTQNDAGFTDVGFKPKYYLACGKDESGNIVPLEVDDNGDIV